MDIISFYAVTHPHTLMGLSMDFSKRFAQCVVLFPLQGRHSWCLVKHAGTALCYLALQILISARWYSLTHTGIPSLGARGAEGVCRHVPLSPS